MNDEEQMELELSGVEKAAILMLGLGEKEAAAVLRHLEPDEVQKLGEVMASFEQVSVPQVEAVVADFVETLEREATLSVDAETFVRNTLVEAFGVEKAASLIDRIVTKPNSKGIETLKWLDSRAVAEIFRFEHPQIVAIVLSYLNNEQAAQVLEYFPDERRADIIMRIATLEGVQPSALEELDEILERQYAGGFGLTSPAGNGIEIAANILNLVDAEVETQITEYLEEADKALAEKIQESMFVFENLLDVDDRGIQTLLREVQSETLLIALKGADAAVREKIFRNMSARAADMLRDDLEAKGPVRLSEVEEAQKEILATAKRLADAGEILLGGKSAAEFV